MTKRVLSLILALLTVASLASPAFASEEPAEADVGFSEEIIEIPEAEEVPEIEEIPETEEVPEIEEAPETEEVPEIEEIPEIEEEAADAPEKTAETKTAAEAAPVPATVKNGWVDKNGKRYYYKNSKMLKGTFVTVGGKTYYLSEKDGHVMKGGFKTVNGKKYYLSAKDGHVLKGCFVTVKGKKYYLSVKDGHVLKGQFKTVGGKKYYLSAKDGHVMKNGWLTVKGKKYYLDKSGVALTGWQVISGKMYRFDSAGVLYIRAGTATRSWVGSLSAAKTTDQLMIVAASGTAATVSLHIKAADGRWYQTLSVSGTIGANGLGKTVQGDKKTPVGVFHFTKAFGINSDPGSVIPYTKVNASHYWVGDSNSRYYNRFVSTKTVTKDWTSGEHLIDYPVVYNYVLALDYNSACVPGAGSAIFLHCSRNGGTTLGCVAIPESAMIQVMRTVDTGCAVIIDTAANVKTY